MPRAAFPSGRKSLLLLVLVVVITAGVWWRQRPPPDPVSDGRRLSEVVFVPNFKFLGADSQAGRERLRSFGPAGVTWLAYQIEDGSYSFIKSRSLPFDRAPEWLRRWVPERWGGRKLHPDVNEPMTAAFALTEFRAGAAPAIPSMARCLQAEHEELIHCAAMVLNCIGPASWPVVHEALEHGSRSARCALLGGMSMRFQDRDEPVPDAEVALIVEALVKGCRDPDSEVRFAALQGMAVSHDAWPGLAPFDAAVSEPIRLLSDANPEVRDAAAFAVGKFGAKGAPATARLIALLDDSSAKIRYSAVSALGLVDQSEKRSADRLRVMLLQDPDAGCRKGAASALAALGISPKEPGASAETGPAR